MDKHMERYSRQILFKPIGIEGQETLADKSVLIVGVGALGTVTANHLVRAGIGLVRLADRDYVEKSNLQRQMLFDEEDVAEALPKAVAAENKLCKINSDVTVEAHVIDVSRQTIEDLMAGVDLVIDGTDNFETRFLLNDVCYKLGVPFVYGGAVSSRGMTAMFVPGETPCLRCFISNGANSGEMCDTVGVLSPVVDIVASYQSVEVLKYLAGAEKRRNSLLTFDVWENRFYEIAYKKAKQGCPCCGTREYPALKDDGQDSVTSLCGRETIQIHLRSSFNLDTWGKHLEAVASVTQTPFLLRADLPEGERLVLFPDGRTLIQGTEEMTRAKSLYTRYIGM